MELAKFANRFYPEESSKAWFGVRGGGAEIVVNGDRGWWSPVCAHVEMIGASALAFPVLRQKSK